MHSRRLPLAYRIVMVVATPFVRWWGRLEVTGTHLLDDPAPIVVFGNHDSHWDPLVAGVAAPNRQIRALAKASLWGNPVVAWVLNHMGQIPIERGRGDAAALARAVEELEGGACIGVFPEGTISQGREMRALSGAGRLALAVPTSRVVGLRITGAVDIVRFPKRPKITAEFFAPGEGQPADGESAVALTKRVMTEVRAGAPFAVAGRKRKPVTGHDHDLALRVRRNSTGSRHE